jgi:hypothetical protein
MLIWLRIILLTAIISIQISCGRQITETTVLIIDESGVCLSGVNVRVTYPLFKTNEYSTGSGLTDDEGIYSYSGVSLAEFVVTANKEGYYESRHEGMVKEGKRKLINPEVVITLKEIKDPIPLHARSRVTLNVPEYEKELGFDCEAADWVAPYGKGKRIDLFLRIDGYYNERDGRDTKLTMTFPNKGDGFIPFTGTYRQGSQLVSDHKAPLDGYTDKKKWRKARIPTEKVNKLGSNIIKYDDYSAELNYYLRLQTKLNSDGNVVRANYAKIYGDLQFDGVWDRDSYIIIYSLYYNPKNSERNLEYDVGNNLTPILRSYQDPQLP